MNITGSVPVLLNQQCNISIIFSNEAGSSEPFILAFNTTHTIPTINPTSSPTGAEETTTLSPDPILFTPEIIGAIVGIAVLLIILIIVIVVVVKCYKKANDDDVKKKNQEIYSDENNGIALETVNINKNESEVNTEHIETNIGNSLQITQTTVVELHAKDDDTSMPYDTAPVEASADTPEGSEMIATQVNKNKKQPRPSTNKKETTTTEAIGGGATKEPIYSELGAAPAAGTRSFAKTEASSVEYADIDKIVPKSKATTQPQSYDDVVVSASGTTVIGATGGDTNPPPIPDKKSKGAATTGQEGTNGETDAARNLPHHVNDDSHFPSPPPPPRPPHPHPPRPPPPPPHSPPPGSGEGGVQPDDIITFVTPSVNFIGDIPHGDWRCLTLNTPNTQVDWLHNGTVISNGTVSTLNELEWTPLHDVSQTGIYTCRVTTSDGTNCGNKSVSLYVIGKLK
ncbi:PREDICTED: histone-lysine N-methyltransferase SETD1B-like [Amphimedon queenslandica]|uniref:Ig-like domain-containing protein n=1 Tax=Amphimedon queenslandica TaxID=400682 RepID=A0AAN0J6J7_AMPQE|nr:PREDICTED: histone-lysine N-methyltransferase SETD1B-like [Amphimedon queenslandica]|eukprot:XP_019852308.1 PREDICTED: histone-lysine N-methyltransferase SETD1B-like [Amphimedon queenslandica]